ncbi:MAG: hypothetical protein LBO66_05785 [Deltaproteobacteria bacterium]|jgi:hypothetical protein|nr:hypothetical protein [Deltaproteobacteria bacterium]
MKDFLDPSIWRDFHGTIDASPIFTNGDEKCHFDLICAVIDRLESCVKYINKHQKPPKTEENFIPFVLFSCMVIDAVKKLLKEIGCGYKYDDKTKAESYQYFKEICLRNLENLQDSDCPTDDKFFEYFRSLVFAHPFETNRPKFLQTDEIQYSPRVIVNSNQTIHDIIIDEENIITDKKYRITDEVGVVIYSNKSKILANTNCLCFSFSILKEYVKSRYALIEIATDWVKQKVEYAHNEWSKRKVNRSLTPIGILQDIKNILESQYRPSDGVDNALACLECETTERANDNAVLTFRHKIDSVITSLCDAMDKFDYEQLEDILSGIIYARSRKMHNMASEQLETILCYQPNAEDAINHQYFIQQVNDFSEIIASKYVIIKPQDMSVAEIKMLVRITCFIECQTQEQSSE